MTKPILIYFDSAASRGEECRLALHVAGVDFEDVRIKRGDWPALKPKTPFGSLPILELPGQPPLAQSIAILTLIGRRHGLHPSDLFEAARHEAIMQYAEDLRASISPTLRISDAAEKKAARESFAANVLPTWAQHAEQHVHGDGPFFGGAALQVADIKLYMIVRWFKSGVLDHIPNDVLDGFPKLVRVHDAVRDDARVKAWTARY